MVSLNKLSIKIVKYIGGYWVKLRKRIMSLGLIILTVSNLFVVNNHFITKAKAATFDEINHPDVFLKQVNGDMQCTLVAATMLIRRAAMLSGNPKWSNITVNQVKNQAWVDGVGLKYTFTYEGITVNKAPFGNDPVSEAITLLQEHPEGIVLYDQYRIPRSHAVLLTDYSNGMFYCADPSDAVPYGRIPINEGLVQVKDSEYYYYVSSPSIPSPTPSINEDRVVLPTTDIKDDSVALPVTDIKEDDIQLSVTDISTYEVTLSQTDYYYDGNEKKPIVTIPGLVENIDYFVLYVDNVYPGSATVVVAGMGAYSGYIIKNFEIREATVYDYFNEINASVTKQTIKKGKSATVKVTMPEALTLVKEFSSNEQIGSNEVKISYSSSNKKIAKVNSKGKITGIKKGKTKIDVTVELVDGTKKIFPLTFQVK